MSSIEPIRSGSMGQIHQREPLTEEQLKKMKEIIEKYASSEMTESSFKSMMEELRDAGIPPSRELRKAMEDAGIDAEQMMPKGPPPPPPPDEAGGAFGSQSIPVELLQVMQEFLDKYNSGSLSEDDLATFASTIEQYGLSGTGNLFDIQA